MRRDERSLLGMEYKLNPGKRKSEGKVEGRDWRRRRKDRKKGAETFNQTLILQGP